MPSQIDFDVPPLYDPILNPKAPMTMADVWIGYWSSFYQTLVSYLTQFGIFIPQLTTAERNSITTPVEGQLIYNTDATPGPPRSAEVQVWQVKAGVGAWRTFTTTP